jgi:ketosteroid isomerase-like protein
LPTPNSAKIEPLEWKQLSGGTLSVTIEYVEKLFRNLSTGNSRVFFENVADDVQWTVTGTHPMAGVYTTKADFLAHTLQRLNKLLTGDLVLNVDHITAAGDTAVVEMTSASTARNGKPYVNRYCWVVRFDRGVIKEVRAYLDSFLVHQTIAENEPPPAPPLAAVKA